MDHSEHERESARACSCPSCRAKYDLPPKDHQADQPSGAVVGLAFCAAVGVGLYYLAKSLNGGKSAPSAIMENLKDLIV